MKVKNQSLKHVYFRVSSQLVLCFKLLTGMQRKKSVPAFIRNTYQMLQREELKDIVSWQEGENGFVIKQLDIFTNEVLPQYFKHKKYPSFVRQLNMYGFHKQRSKDNLHSYDHEFFRKGVLQNKDKLLFQQVLKRKPEKKKKSSNEVKNGKQEHQKQQKSLSQEQSDINPSVSIELEEQKEYLNSSQMMQSHSRWPRNQSRAEERRMSKTESINISAAELEDNQQSSNTPHQTKMDFLVIQQNTILQSVHRAIREQLLKCKQILKQHRQKLRNRAVGLGQILNNGEPIDCGLRLAHLLNQQNATLQRLVTLSLDLQNSEE